MIGRYNAAIVLMGVFLEALMKERIRLKLGTESKGAYGECLNEIKSSRLMNIDDIDFLSRFKNEVRNPYQHANEAEILRGLLAPVWPIKLEGVLSFEKLNKFMDGVKTGRLRPQFLPVSEIPALRSITKQAHDRELAIKLFNQVYDFLIGAQIKYFKQDDYTEHNKKFGTGLENVEHYTV